MKETKKVNNNKFIYKNDTILKFGKFKGYSLRHAITVSPMWVKWALDNVEWFHISESAKEDLKVCIANEQREKLERRHNHGQNYEDYRRDHYGDLIPDDMHSDFQFMDFFGNY